VNEGGGQIGDKQREKKEGKRNFDSAAAGRNG
jgi:hypothetical protein